MITFVIGAISLSYAAGSRVASQVKLQSTSDNSSVAMAAHASQGLNMISVNNQGLGAALQFNHALLVLGYYLIIAKTATYQIDDLLKQLKSIWDLNKSPFQTDVFDRLYKVGKQYYRVAGGMTEYNEMLTNNWLYGTPLKSIEYARINSPGSLVFPSQGNSAVPFKLMRYNQSSDARNPYLRKAKPKDTICAVTSVKPDGDDTKRDAILQWLLGPIWASDTLSNSSDKISTLLVKTEDFITKYMPISLGIMNCGLAVKSPFFNLFSLESIGDLIPYEKLVAIIQGAEAADNVVKLVDSYWPNISSGWICTPVGTFHPLISGYIYAAFGITTVLGDGKLRDEVFRSEMIKKMREKDNRSEAEKRASPMKIFYSKNTVDECEKNPEAVDTAHAKNPNDPCAQAFVLTDRAWVCPLKREIKAIVPEDISCVKTEIRSNRVRVRRQSPMKRLFRHLDRWCGPDGANYDDWVQAAKIDNKAFMMVNWAEQAKVFRKASRKNDKFGFTVMKKGQYPNFLTHMQFKNMVSNPILTPEETKTLLEKCQSSSFDDIVDPNLSTCRMDFSGLLSLSGEPPNVEAEVEDGADAPTEEAVNRANQINLTRRIQSGGVYTLASRSSVWQRMQWGMAKARTFYYPMSDYEPNLSGQAHMKIFWPAWSASIVPEKTSDFIPKKRDGTVPTVVKVIDNLLGRG